MKILLIEDDPETAAYIANGLKEHGHTVDQAPNGRDGLLLAAGEPYEVMIIDRMLPGLDGLAIVKTIRGAGVENSRAVSDNARRDRRSGRRLGGGRR